MTVKGLQQRLLSMGDKLLDIEEKMDELAEVARAATEATNRIAAALEGMDEKNERLVNESYRRGYNAGRMASKRPGSQPRKQYARRRVGE